MKVTCQECKHRQMVPDEDIMRAVEQEESLRGKMFSLLGRLTGGKTKLDADGRRQRALKAVQAREAKRNACKMS